MADVQRSGEIDFPHPSDPGTSPGNPSPVTTIKVRAVQQLFVLGVDVVRAGPKLVHLPALYTVDWPWMAHHQTRAERAQTVPQGSTVATL